MWSKSKSATRYVCLGTVFSLARCLSSPSFAYRHPLENCPYLLSQYFSWPPFWKGLPSHTHLGLKRKGLDCIFFFSMNAYQRTMQDLITLLLTPKRGGGIGPWHPCSNCSGFHCLFAKQILFFPIKRKLQDNFFPIKREYIFKVKLTPKPNFHRSSVQHYFGLHEKWR